MILLSDAEGLSNARVRTELNLSNERYFDLRNELIENELVEIYVCRGGGVRLTRKGEKEVALEPEAGSSVSKEQGLYTPFIEMLNGQASEDESSAVVCPTYLLKARGQWQNPDVTKVEI